MFRSAIYIVAGLLLGYSYASFGEIPQDRIPAEPPKWEWCSCHCNCSECVCYQTNSEEHFVSLCQP